MGERLAAFLFPVALGSALLYLMLGLLLVGLYLTRDASRWQKACGTLGLLSVVVTLGWVLTRLSPLAGAVLTFVPVILAIPVSVAGSMVALALLVAWFYAAGHETWDTRRALAKRAALIGLLLGAVLGALTEIWFLQQLSPSLRRFG
ncbi:MAG: hypothetical protein ACREOH_04130 [Candidatus Entotheonellia bacterium]